MAKKTFSISEALNFGWKTALKNYWFILISILVAGVAASVPGIISERISEDLPIFGLVFSIAGVVLGVVVEMGLIAVMLKFVDGKKPRLADLFSTLPLFFNYVFASLLYGGVVVAGLIFFIVPGVVLALMMWPFSYLIVDKKLGALEALQNSADLTNGVRGQLFLFGLAVFGINLLGALPLLLGLLVTIPTTMLASARVYRQLTK